MCGWPECSLTERPENGDKLRGGVGCPGGVLRECGGRVVSGARTKHGSGLEPSVVGQPTFRPLDRASRSQARPRAASRPIAAWHRSADEQMQEQRAYMAQHGYIVRHD